MIKKTKSKTFLFGKNWLDYVNNFLDEDKINGVKESLLKYLPERKYRGKTFIDIGCGSGIFSLAALRLGCEKVISFDVDKYSIEATNLVKGKFSFLLPEKAEWKIFEGSILDDQLKEKLKSKGDIVYSWGVLHHTGNMYRAIKNAAELVASKGYFIIAIYNRAPSSDYWLKVKNFYNYSPKIIKILLSHMVFSYIIIRRFGSYLKSIFMGRPRLFKLSKILERERGMSIFYDVNDWLGGYPYEYAIVDEINAYVKNLGFELISNPTKLDSPQKNFSNQFSFNNTGCNEFVFKKK